MCPLSWRFASAIFQWVHLTPLISPFHFSVPAPFLPLIHLLHAPEYRPRTPCAGLVTICASIWTWYPKPEPPLLASHDGQSPAPRPGPWRQPTPLDDLDAASGPTASPPVLCPPLSAPGGKSGDGTPTPPCLIDWPGHYIEILIYSVLSWMGPRQIAPLGDGTHAKKFQTDF
jgi:hypothetical protein